MGFAVKDRPIEKFDTELNLPEWQTEPDDEYFFGDPDDYYYIDDQGNLVEPGQSSSDNDVPFPIEGEGPLGEGVRPQSPGVPEDQQAADDDFLEQAIGAPIPPDAPANSDAESEGAFSN